MKVYINTDIEGIAGWVFYASADKGLANLQHLERMNSLLTEEVNAAIAACREAVGPDFVMMVDVQYAWSDVDAVLRTTRDWKDLDIYFLETPLQIDDLEGYARLHRESSIRYGT